MQKTTSNNTIYIYVYIYICVYVKLPFKSFQLLNF